MIGVLRVCLDPGHGGRDPGAIGVTGVQEKVINLAVAVKVMEMLEAHGIRVWLTRYIDKHLGATTAADLAERARIANAANVGCFVSIHCNSATNTSAQGTETYCVKGAVKARTLAEGLQKRLVNALGRPDRGVKEANFAVLRDTEMPAALVELAFLSNATEEAMLEQDDFQRRAAQAIATGIMEYLGIEPVKVDGVPVHVGGQVLSGIQDNDGNIYAPVRQFAELLGKTVHWDGGRVFIFDE